MAACWLAGGLGAAGWLAGRPRAAQDPAPHPLEGKKGVPGALATTYLKAYKTGTRKLTSYKTAGLQGLQGYKITGTTGYLLQRYPSQPGGSKGPAYLCCGCLDLYVGCSDVYFGCLDLYVGCLDLLFCICI